MNARINPKQAPLRDQILAHLAKVEDASAAEICRAIRQQDTPSRVTKELNALRTDGLVEREGRKGKEYRYWAAAALPVVTTAPEGKRNANVRVDTAAQVKSARVDVAGEAKPDFARDPELQYLAPEDYEMPPADPALLASANRMLSERLDGVAHVLRGCGLPALRDISGGEDLQPAAAALSGAYQMAVAQREAWVDVAACYGCDTPSELGGKIVEMGGDLANARALAAKLQTLLDSKTHECEALRAELANTQQDGEQAVDVLDAAHGYLVKAPKRKPRFLTQPEAARNAAMACARNGSGRGDVYALVHVGTAKRGAEWTESN